MVWIIAIRWISRWKKKKKMRKIIIICWVGFMLTGCTVINREYSVTMNVCENSIVYFTPEILADIEKDSEVESKTDVKTDAQLDTSVIPK